MAEAGAPAKAIIEMLRIDFEREEAKRVVKRPKDAKRKRERLKATKGGNTATVSDQERLDATVSDTPRARLFREGKPALLTLKIADSRAGALIAQWLKLTNDDEQLVLATILKAQGLAVADAPSWILATLKGKTDERRGSLHPDSRAQQSGSTAVLAGVAAAAERRARERSPTGRNGQIPPDDDAAQRPDPELFGTG
jgi:hypothetical protein